MEYQDIKFEVHDGVAVITLNRPDHLNALGGMLSKEWGEAYRFCDDNDDIRVVVVTGAGRAFCTGADMGRGAESFGKKQDEATFSTAAVNPPAWQVSKPVIAAINGHAVGNGLTLAMQCDIRFIAREGKYGFFQVRRGVIPESYASWTVLRIMGLSRAADLILSGRTINGDEAVELGLANRVLPADEVLPAALEYAKDIAVNTSPLAVALAKRLLWESSTLIQEELLRKETECQFHLMGRPDAAEGVMAFLEKRTPRWKLSIKNEWPYQPK